MLERVEPAMRDDRIRVEQNDVRASACNATVGGGGESAVALVVQQDDAGIVPLRELAEKHGNAGIDRRVVDQHERERIRGAAEHALDAAPGVVRRVVDRHDDSHARRAIARHAVRIRFQSRRTRSKGSRSHQRTLSRYATRRSCASICRSKRSRSCRSPSWRSSSARARDSAMTRRDVRPSPHPAAWRLLAQLLVACGQAVRRAATPRGPHDRCVTTRSRRHRRRAKAQDAGGSGSTRDAATTTKYIGAGADASLTFAAIPTEPRSARLALRSILPSRDSGAGRTSGVPESGRRDARKLVAVELAKMIGIGVRARVAVLGAIRRREDQHAVGYEHARELVEHLQLLFRVHVLDGFERHDHVDAGVAQRKPGHRRRQEREVIALAVRERRRGDDRSVDVDADDRLRGHGEQRRTVAFTARGVEHAPAGHEATRECVAVTVLVGDLAGHAGEKPLARELISGYQGGFRGRGAWSASTLPERRILPERLRRPFDPREGR